MRADYLVSTCASCAARSATGVAACAATSTGRWSTTSSGPTGYFPTFGFFSFDPVTLRRTERPSARVFARIARTGKLP